jgi:hypothetical protein
MPYIGRQPQVGRYTTIDDISSSFNGSLTSFTMQNGGQAVNVYTPATLIISLGGVIQKPGTDFTVSGSTLTFTTAPTSGTSFFAYLLGDTLNVGMASDNAVLTRSIADGAVTGAKLNANLAISSSNVVFSGANTVFTSNVNFSNTSVVNFTGANVVGLSASATGGGGGSITGVTVISETANGDLDFSFYNTNTNINMTDPYIQSFFSASSNTTINANGFLTVTF